MSLSTALLVSFVTCETSRTIYAYHAFHVSHKITPPLITLISEVLKLIVATIFVYRSEFAGLWKTEPRAANEWSKCLRSAVPAALFLINTLIFYTVLPLVSPTLLTICILAKLPITAILYHVVVRKQRNVYAWTSLFWLCVGIVIFNIPTSKVQPGFAVAGKTFWFIAPVSGLAIASIGSVASIYMEMLTKAGDFWESQFWLYTWGVVLAGVSYPASAILYAMTKRNETPVEVPLGVYVFPAAVLIIITGGTGLVVAVMLRRRDNLLKLVGTSATLISTAVAQSLLLPSLRDGKLGFLSMFGGGLVVVMTYSYNFYQNQPWWEENKGYRGIPVSEHTTGIDLFADEEKGIELLCRSSSDSTHSTLRNVALEPAPKLNELPESKLFVRETAQQKPELEKQEESKDNFEAVQDIDFASTYFDPNATKITCLLLCATFLAIETL